MGKRSSTRITKTVVDGLGPDQVVWDAEVKGFGVRCQTKAKSYILKANIQGHWRQRSIGIHGSPWTPDTARAEAKRLLGEIVQGKDPRKTKASDRIRVNELCARYLKEYAIPERKKASSISLDRMNINNHILPLLGRKFVDELEPADIEAFKNDVLNGKTAPKDIKEKQKEQGGGRVVKGGPGVSNRCLALLSVMLNQAELWGLRPKHSNPVKDVPRYREEPVKRFLKPAELQKLGEVLDRFEQEGSESIYAIAAIRLLIFTGARLSEILTLKWDYVQLDHQRLRLPDSKTGAKTIELNKPAVNLIQSLPRLSNNPFVIVGRRHEQHLVDLQRPWQRARSAAGLSDFRIHDLRHTFASLAILNGQSIHAVAMLLGHKSINTTHRYAHLERSYIATENDKIGQFFEKAMSSKKARPERSASPATDDGVTD